MNKQEFLNELQTRIRILADAEQRDILDEYAQHIDLKLDKGLSEDAATADFGGLDALAAEILEAYHVNPAFVTQPKKEFSGVKIVSMPDPRPGLKRAGTATAGFFRRVGGAVAGFFRRCGQLPGKLVHLLQIWPRTAKPKKEKKERPPMESKYFMQRTGNALRRFFRGLGRLILALIRLAWNVFLLLAAAPVTLAGIFLLVSVGALVVLLTQGYPLAGITLCCVGGVLCCGSVLVLGGGLRHRRKKPESAPVETESPVIAESVETTDLEVYHA